MRKILKFDIYFCIDILDEFKNIFETRKYSKKLYFIFFFENQGDKIHIKNIFLRKSQIWT